MEEYKDVMLSEPPSRFTAAPAVQSMSLENYKGILLCDRPTVGAVNKASEGSVPFLPAGKGDDRYVGLQPSVESRSRYELSRSMRQNSKVSKPSALTRHKKWLYSFASAVKKMQLDKVERQLEDAESQKKLRDHQRDQRLLRKHALEAQGDAKEQEVASGNTSAPADTSVPAAPGRAPVPVVAANDTSVTASVKPPKDKKKKAKPKWAMTEDEALDAELNENDALIAFAHGLNYDKFIDDFEVREALAIMRDRVKELATEQGVDLADVERAAQEDADGKDSVTGVSEEGSAAADGSRRVKREAQEKDTKRADATPQAEAADSRPAWNNSTVLSEKFRHAVSHEAVALADKLLQSTPSLQQLHTKHSLARLLQSAAMSNINESTVARRAEGAANVPYVPAVQPPPVSIHSAESVPTGEQKQTRILLELKKKKDHVQNLPYMYRCPSL